MRLLAACIAMILSLIVFASIDGNTSQKHSQVSVGHVPDLIQTDLIQDLQPRSFEDLSISEQEEVRCLAHNIYFEARGEPEAGQIAVALVTLNRVESKKFPETICKVVKERKRATCQFSWWCDNNLRYQSRTNKIREREIYNEVKQLALDVFYDRHEIEDITGGALFYHAKYVSRHKLGRMKIEPTATIGQHVFYRMSNEQNAK